jgi:Tryptophan halogenase
VIIGRGAAGWLTVGILAAEYKNNPEVGIQITLIESSNVNTIGVGEGIWPSMREMLRKIGASERIWLPSVRRRLILLRTTFSPNQITGRLTIATYIEFIKTKVYQHDNPELPVQFHRWYSLQTDRIAL